MAVLKIPQSTQQAKAGGNLSGIDTTLPLNLARQQGAAISSVGKVFEDIYFHLCWSRPFCLRHRPWFLNVQGVWKNNFLSRSKNPSLLK